MSKWQNASVALYDGVGKYGFPAILPVYELPEFDRVIEFDYCKRVKANYTQLGKSLDRIGIHYFEDDYKFERIWNNPDTYARMISEFGFTLGPDFSMFKGWPQAVMIYNKYRNHWLARYWQEEYKMTVIPTVMWGEPDTWDWCFEGYPKNSIVAVSNVGHATTKGRKSYFNDGYMKMLEVLNPSKILFFTKNFQEMPGNVQYISWELYKGVQLNG